MRDHVDRGAAGGSFVAPLFAALVVSVAIVEGVATRVGAPGPSIAVLRNPFANIAVATILVRYLIHERNGRRRRWIVHLTPATALVAWFAHRRGMPVPLVGMAMMFAIGLLGVFGFALAALSSSHGDERRAHVRQLMQAMTLPLAASMVSFGLWSTYPVNPVYDARVYAFEEILGPRFPLLGVASYRLLHPLSSIATLCYAMLAFALTLVAAGQRSFAREAEVLLATVSAGALGFSLYFVCPVVGPLYVFAPPYPDALPPVPAGAPLLTAVTGVPRNGMPSLHTAWALLIWFNARPLPVAWRRAARLFAALTVWAAMGPPGTHWIMDLVVSVPLAVALQSICVSARSDPSSRTWRRALACGALVAIWLAAFRSGWPLLDLSPLVAWIAVAATVGWPLASQRGAPL